MNSSRRGEQVTERSMGYMRGNRQQPTRTKFKIKITGKGSRDTNSLRFLFTSEFKRMFERLKTQNDGEEFKRTAMDIISFYRDYKTMIDFRETCRIMRRCLPALLVEKQVQDSNVVAEYLRCIDEMRDRYPLSLSLFLVSAMSRAVGLGSEEAASGAKSPCSYLEFFLRHARNSRLTFRGKRLAQLLLGSHPDYRVSTVLFTKPASILKLLQYEGRLLSAHDDWNDSCQEVMAYALELLIFCGLTSNLWDSKLNFRDPSGKLPEYMQKMLANFRMFLRTAPNSYSVVCKLANVELGLQTGPLPDVKCLLKFLRILYADEDIAEPQPSSLKHLCRIAIRKKLNENWQLPDGIYSLGLSKGLEEYLNLLE